MVWLATDASLSSLFHAEQQMLQIESQVAELQVLFPGMRLLLQDKDCRDVEEPIQVRIIEALPVFQATVSILEKRWQGEERTGDMPLVPPQQQAACAQDGSMIWHRDALCSVLASPFRDAGLSRADVSIVSVDLDAHRTVDRRINVKVRIERLKQDPDTVQVLCNAVQEQDIDAELVPFFKSLSRTIKRLLLDADRGSPESVQDLIIHTGGGADQVDMRRVRAVLVCMDANISSNDDALQVSVYAYVLCSSKLCAHLFAQIYHPFVSWILTPRPLRRSSNAHWISKQDHSSFPSYAPATYFPTRL